jgi:exodeoxyribonuclease V beta subunit
MTAPRPLDLLNVPLAGVNLIEASAGTGKTYAITGLFLRLLLEQNLALQDVLVVTFTEAATAELKHRIRTRLRQAVRAFAEGGSEDLFLDELVRRHQGDPEQAGGSLGEALRAFDLAAISTIHGFCLRMLRENAFESGSLFDSELIADQASLIREVVEDFWRIHIAEGPALFVSYAINRGTTPDRLVSLLGHGVTQPCLTILPEPEVADSSRVEREYLACFKEMRTSWSGARAEVERVLTNWKGLNRNKYRKGSIPLWLASMDEYMEQGEHDSALFTEFRKFTTRELEAAVKRGSPPPAHPFFGLCQRLQDAQAALEELFRRRLLALKAELFHQARRELASRKRERNVMSFDDLLVRLHQALEDRGGEALARAIRGKLKAALIDEFQDTDPTQYAIFRKVFGSGDGPLFLIGDPKQAIYGFRGADLFAYLAASSQAESKYTLGENRRSEPGLIAAVNTIFSAPARPFVFDEIPFHPAAGASEKGPVPLAVEGKARPSLYLWFLNAGTGGRSDEPLKKGPAQKLLPRVVAAEISRLLHLGRSGRALIGERPLGEGDMAVLVRRNLEARLMQEALSELHIPSVLYSTGDLFETDEALDVERLLRGIAEPNDSGLLKAALATELLGIKGEELEQLLADDVAWERWIVSFRGFRDIWNEEGFIVMFRRLLAEQGVLPRLMFLPGGERRDTNLLHLVEVLHRAAVDRKLGMGGVLKWLAEQRDSRTPRLEEHQLRLESDERAVKLVTVHKSKGLEYPIVFCPFAWNGSRIRDRGEPLIFHGAEMGLTLDLGSEEREAHRLMAERELLAENIRLLYVALTRARNRSYLVWGRFRDGETSAPAYLFHQGKTAPGEEPVAALAARVGEMDDEAMLSELRAIERKGEGTIALTETALDFAEESPPLPVSPVKLVTREQTVSVAQKWRVASFSALVSAQPHRAELADRDQGTVPEPPEVVGPIQPGVPTKTLDRFAFPGGARSGTLLHDILEHLDFSAREGPSLEELVAGKLEEYAFEPSWRDSLCSMLAGVLAAPLVAGCPALSLSRIERRDRLNELEFYFPLKQFSSALLRSLFAAHGGPAISGGIPEHLERLQFAPVRGYMKGFMDLVFRFDGRFYLVDWKSNLLGDRPEDYRAEALARVMAERFYVLQYCLYTVALDQYFRLRLPGYDYDQHFGGVFYIFLRGVDRDLGPEYGIFRDRPARRLVEALRETLIDFSSATKGVE